MVIVIDTLDHSIYMEVEVSALYVSDYKVVPLELRDEHYIVTNWIRFDHPTLDARLNNIPKYIVRSYDKNIYVGYIVEEVQAIFAPK